MGDSPARANEDETRGLTLRELVLEVRADVKDVKSKFGLHLVDHAVAQGAAQARKGMLVAILTFSQRLIPPAALIGALLAILGVKA
jgi:hypothetical protein